MRSPAPRGVTLPGSVEHCHPISAEAPLDIETISRWPGKSPRHPESQFYPAACHMIDVAAVAERLAEGCPLEEWAPLLIALHDLGKIGEPFRRMIRDGARQPWRHWEVTEALLRHAPIETFLLLGWGSAGAGSA